MRGLIAYVALASVLALSGCSLTATSAKETIPVGTAQTVSPKDGIAQPRSSTESAPPVPKVTPEQISTLAPPPPADAAPPAAPARTAAPAAPASPAPVCATGSAGWGLDAVALQPLEESVLRNLGTGNEFRAVVTITIINGANYALRGHGTAIELAVPTARYPGTRVTAYFGEVDVPANAHVTLTTTAGTILTESSEVPKSWSVGSSTRAGSYNLQVPSDTEYFSRCGVAYPQSFALLN